MDQRIQESTTLDFKRQLPDVGKNDDLARAIAALANTAGGCLIYGIDEEDDSRAAAIVPLALAGSTERIALVARTLDEPVTLTDIYTIEQTEGLGCVVVVLPFSDRAPHFSRGVAYGRTPKTTEPLSRRQIGELFARSTGFVNEFRLSSTKPGRVLVQGERDLFNGQPATRLSFTNDGETDVTDVDWLDAPLAGVIVSTGLPFPMTVLRPGAQVKVTVAVPAASPPSHLIRIRWTDDRGRMQTEDWQITF